ncbi:MAG: DUF3768 domain-containing protein [Rickettsiales bacterium]|jgi:hypothetical protein|nr:DUF3768 domain-containing protein [Rickettsiales bacterium]
MRDVLKIRKLNDEFRRTLSDGQVFFTQGVRALSPRTQIAAIKKIMEFDDFGGNPSDEHDFGFFNLSGRTILFQIDCLEAQSQRISANPDNSSKNRRILSVMLTDEC